MRCFLLFVAALSFAISQTACKKDPIVRTVRTDTTVLGNQPPNYTGVPSIDVKLYVNKLYVDVLGREPNATELQTDVDVLLVAQLSQSSREQLVDQLLNDTMYYRRLYELTSADFIQGASEVDIQQKLNEFTYIRDSLVDPANYTLRYYFDYEIGRLDALALARQSLQNGTAAVNDFYSRFLDNYYYDQINMGSLNFVKAAFENLFLRAPTAAELASGIDMVENRPATLLYADGANRLDFLNIVSHADAFYAGLSRKIYLQLLLREPDSDELAAAVALIKPNADVKALQKKILTSKAYAGF